jgi:superfamily I DNA/RNA helicase
MTVVAAHDARQIAAIEAAGDACVAIVGPPGSGKTTALVGRTARFARAIPDGSGTRVLALAPSDAGVARLQRETLPDAALRTSFGDLAFDIIEDERARAGGRAVERSDDVRASQRFKRAGAELFALEWTAFAEEVDPEITGMRAPERFSAAAFRLFRKLRASLISSAEFRTIGLRGAATFYARPPNFASADLIMDTGGKYRDSLRVSAVELERQHQREIDLVKILARLYASYEESLAASGSLTPTDAVYEAVMLLRENDDARARIRARYAAAFVDDAQDLTAGQLALLEAIFGKELGGVTLAGDADQSTRGFAAGARGREVFTHATVTFALGERHRCDPAIERAARRALDPAAPLPPEFAGTGNPDAVSLYRAESSRDEARFVAAEIEQLLRAGTPPERIAVVLRNFSCAQTYAGALLARNLPVDIAGAGSLYEFPIVLDALGALWSVVDPFRHDYLLRTLEAPWLRLSDASIATLCADATDPQPLLFELDDDVAETGERRWDRRRSLRLGRNVTRGDVDADLPAEARERLGAFRSTRLRWETASRTLGVAALARLVFDESVLATLRPDARGRFDATLVARLVDEIAAFEARDPFATLDDFLAFAESVANAESDLLAIAPRDRTAVRVLDVEAAKGEEFDAVFVVDVRAGAWPRYYVPDAFLFTPKAGMIPKENVGDADAARTAKFTYALFRYQFRRQYNAEERRAFYCAATRARKRLYISASGRATRGENTPEILEELRP